MIILLRYGPNYKCSYYIFTMYQKIYKEVKLKLVLKILTSTNLFNL